MRQSFFISIVLLISMLCAAQVDIPPDTTADELVNAGKNAFNAQNYPLAESLFNTLLQRFPKHKEVWLLLGGAQLAQRRFSDAVHSYRKQIEVNAFDPIAYTNLGMALRDMGNFKEAEQSFRKQLEINPLDDRAHAYLGQEFLRQKRFQEAIKELETARDLAPDDMFWAAMLGSAYNAIGETAKGNALIAEATRDAPPRLLPGPADLQLDADPKFVHQTSDIAVFNIFTEQASAKLADASHDDYVRTARLSKHWGSKGAAYLRTGDLVQAEKYLHAAFLLTQAGVIADQLGQLYEKKNMVAKAAEYYAFGTRALPRSDASAGHLEKLVGKAKADLMIRSAGGRLSRLRTFTLSAMGTKEGNAVFAVMLGNFNGPGVEGAKFIAGDQHLRSLEKSVAALKIPAEFPDPLTFHIIQKGMVSCRKSGCVFVIIPSDIMSANEAFH